MKHVGFEVITVLSRVMWWKRSAKSPPWGEDKRPGSCGWRGPWRNVVAMGLGNGKDTVAFLTPLSSEKKATGEGGHRLVGRVTPRPCAFPHPHRSARRKGVCGKPWGARGAPSVPPLHPRPRSASMLPAACLPSQPRAGWGRHSEGMPDARTLRRCRVPRSSACRSLTRLLRSFFVNKTNPCFSKVGDFSIYNVYL